ncbi:hypothetical protein M8494_35750 [Serratia ureilytica]
MASEWLPLAPAQLDFWEEHTLHPGQTLSTVAHCTELCGAVGRDALPGDRHYPRRDAGVCPALW